MDKTEKKVGVGNKISNLAQSWINFAEFIKAHPILSGSMAALLALIYAGQAFSNYYYIDKEQLVNNPGSFYNWNEIGRFGLIFVKRLLNLSWYNPYMGGVLLLVTLWLCAMAAGYLFYSVDNWFGAAPMGVFMLLFLIYPTYVDQFLFQYQAFEVMLAVLFLMVSNWYLVRAVREQNRMAFCHCAGYSAFCHNTCRIWSDRDGILEIRRKLSGRANRMEQGNFGNASQYFLLFWSSGCFGWRVLYEGICGMLSDWLGSSVSSCEAFGKECGLVCAWFGWGCGLSSFYVGSNGRSHCAQNTDDTATC